MVPGSVPRELGPTKCLSGVGTDVQQAEIENDTHLVEGDEMALYVALLYYDRDQYWNEPPETELTSEYTALRAGRPKRESCAAVRSCTR